MTRLKKIIVIVVAAVMVFVCIIAGAGCSSGNGNEALPTEDAGDGDGTYQPEISAPPIVYPYTFEDQTGYSVTLPHEPMTVVTVGPDITEIMFAIGRGIQIIGRSEEDSFPADVEEIPSIGSVNSPDAEAISKLKPDIILVTDKVPAEKIAEIREKNIPTVVINTPQTFEGIYDSIKYIGRVLNGEKAAYSYVVNMQGDISTMLINNGGNEKHKVCIVTEYSEETDTVITSKANISKYGYYEDVIKTVGGKSCDINEEPYYIVCIGEKLKTQVEKSTAMQDLAAVKMGRVYYVYEDFFELRSTRSINALYAIAEIMGYTLF